jgi:hypothetical protein
LGSEVEVQRHWQLLYCGGFSLGCVEWEDGERSQVHLGKRQCCKCKLPMGPSLRSSSFQTYGQLLYKGALSPTRTGCGGEQNKFIAETRQICKCKVSLKPSRPALLYWLFELVGIRFLEAISIWLWLVTDSCSNLADIVSQNARNPKPAPQLSTTSMSALSVSLVRTTKSQWTRSTLTRTVSKNASLHKYSFLRLMLMPHSLPSCSLRKPMRRTKAMERA